MDKLVMTPQQVRGLGNLLTPKGVDDLILYKSLVETTNEGKFSIDYTESVSDYFGKLYRKINNNTNITSLYTGITESNGVLNATAKAVSSITKVSDLNGVIYGLNVDDNDNWNYSKFTASGNSLSLEEYTHLQTALCCLPLH